MSGDGGSGVSAPRWRRKDELDSVTDGWSPVPTRIVSNKVSFAWSRHAESPEKIDEEGAGTPWGPCHGWANLTNTARTTEESTVL